MLFTIHLTAYPLLDFCPFGNSPYSPISPAPWARIICHVSSSVYLGKSRLLIICCLQSSLQSWRYLGFESTRLLLAGGWAASRGIHSFVPYQPDDTIS